MFQRMFGGGGGNKPPVSASSANKTVEAIQKLGEVRCPIIATPPVLRLQQHSSCKYSQLSPISHAVEPSSCVDH